VINSLKKLRDLGAKTLYPAHGKPFPFTAIEPLVRIR